MSKLCKVKGCGKKFNTRDYCSSHYDWFRYHGFKEEPKHLIGFPTGKLGAKLSPKNWTKQSIAWLAGLLEGEGCWSTVKNKASSTLTCTMADEDIIKRIKKIIGGGNILFIPRPKPFKNLWQYDLCTSSAIYAISCAVFPLMGKRRKKKITEFMQNCNYIQRYP